jgi:hypothetical protein
VEQKASQTDLKSRLDELRRQARGWALVTNREALNDTLIDINLIKVLLEWPLRVGQRGNIEPYRFR